MFSRHVGKDLSAYCHGELTVAETRRVAEHLIGCGKCRSEYEEIKLGIRFAERVSPLEVPDSVCKELEKLLDRPDDQHVQIAHTSDIKRVFWRPRLIGVAATLVLVIGLGAFWFYRQMSENSWEVASLAGAPRINSARIFEKSRLAVGQWLETDEVSRARINVSSIGNVEIDPNTKVKLLETSVTEHRLELARGRLSAKIWAPPRLFFVNTPSAVAADLGCAYTLEVDDKGGSLLRVTAGWVALQLRDKESVVPAGAACATRPGIGPGTPYFEDASEAFRTALARADFEFEKSTEWQITLETLLNEARPRDTLSLWHLLSRVEGADRERVYERMAVLIPPPAGVTRDGVLQLNDEMLHLWKGHLENNWSDDSALRRLWIKTWTRSLGKIKGTDDKK